MRRLARAPLATLLGPSLLLAGLAASVEADEKRVYDLSYELRIVPSRSAAEVEIRVSQSEALLRALRLEIDPERHAGFAGDGEIRHEDGDVVWLPPAAGGVLSYTAQIDHVRESSEYDARSTKTWALFRGMDVIPRLHSRVRLGAVARTRLRFRLAPAWRVAAPFVEESGRRFRIEQAGRNLDVPRGWMIAGKLDVATAQIAGTRVTIAAPADHDVRARDMIALLRWTLPELADLLPSIPERILVVSAGDPMWRGGLSGPGSIYLHADRPLIDADGTSPLLHEILHVAMGARSGERGDWIVEGLAEYYSIQLLLRSGTMTREEHRETLEDMREDAEDVESVLVEGASSDVTDRAVLILTELDREIRSRTDGRRGLDDVLPRLVALEQPLSYARFREQVAEVGGEALDEFFSEHVR